MLQKIAEILSMSAGKPIGIMKRALTTKVRPGNKFAQSTTGKTANSIEASQPTVVADSIEWDFKSNDAAVRLNNGGSLKTKGSSDVPYSGKGGGGESAYIGALIKWAKQKHGLDDKAAKKMAFAVAGAAKDRGRTVKAAGWLDDAKAEIDRQIMSDITSAIGLIVNQTLNNALR